MKPNTVDNYIALQPVETQKMLEEIRAIIRSVAKDADETISYMIPGYRYHGMLVGFGAHKKGCSFYPMDSKILKNYARELKDFKQLTGTIHFSPDQKLPVSLLKKIVRQRMKANEQKEALKKQKKKQPIKK